MGEHVIVVVVLAMVLSLLVSGIVAPLLALARESGPQTESHTLAEPRVLLVPTVITVDAEQASSLTRLSEPPPPSMSPPTRPPKISTMIVPIGIGLACMVLWIVVTFALAARDLRRVSNRLGQARKRKPARP